MHCEPVYCLLSATGIIGGADGPTAVLVAAPQGSLAPAAAAAGVILLITLILFIRRKRS